MLFIDFATGFSTAPRRKKHVFNFPNFFFRSVSENRKANCLENVWCCCEEKWSEMLCIRSKKSKFARYKHELVPHAHFWAFKQEKFLQTDSTTEKIAGKFTHITIPDVVRWECFFARISARHSQPEGKVNHVHGRNLNLSSRSTFIDQAKEPVDLLERFTTIKPHLKINKLTSFFQGTKANSPRKAINIHAKDLKLCWQMSFLFSSSNKTINLVHISITQKPQQHTPTHLF